MKKRLLLVDDTELVLKLEEVILRKRGYELLRARDGVEALAAVNRDHPVAVLLDFNMPKMSGDKVCKAIKDNPATSSTVVIMVTSKGDDETRERCERMGADYFVTKPIDPKAISNILDAAGL